MFYLQTLYPINGFNQEVARQLGSARWGASFRDINEHENDGQLYLRLYFYDEAQITQSEVDAFVAMHDPTHLTQNQINHKEKEEADERLNAKASIKIYLESVEMDAVKVSQKHNDPDVRVLAAGIIVLSTLVRDLLDSR